MAWPIEQTDFGRIVIPPSLPEGLALFCTTIDFDGRLNDDIAAELMRIVRERFDVDAALATCNQVHGKTVARPRTDDRWQECDSCDALWSADAGTALGIKGADCLPVAIADMEHGVIANIHSGWRGTVQRITAETLDVLDRETSFDVATARAWLGPSIQRCCFEVGEEVVDALRVSYPRVDELVDRGRSKPHVDLAALTIALLVERGFAPMNVHDSELCTRCDGSIFHSYRRERGGRNLAIVGRRGGKSRDKGSETRDQSDQSDQTDQSDPPDSYSSSLVSDP